jgi:alpha-N-acetylglucosaminidase
MDQSSITGFVLTASRVFRPGLKYGLYFLLSLILLSCRRGEQKAADRLIERMLPSHSSQFTTSYIGAEDGIDVFEIGTGNGKIILRGNNDISLASAFNHYLKYVAGGSISWNCGDQLNLPAVLPLPDEEIRRESPNTYRYMYNYCAHGYTTPWWDWDKWERELDYLAMNGINLALITQGQEMVYLHTLRKFGFTDEEIQDWLVMPQLQPFLYMGVMEAYGGPVPISLIERRYELALKIVGRMRELGIEPVMNGFFGPVPPGFRKKPDIHIHDQGMWQNMKRPDMLDPLDPVFQEFAGAYYASFRDLFGNVNFFAGDPFHEGGRKEDMDVIRGGQVMHKAMIDYNPDVTWILQCWGRNPLQEMLDALDKSRLLVLDLNADRKNNWLERDAFGQTPWLFCVISNFGGNTGLDGDLQHFANGYVEALRHPEKGPMMGIGVLAEGTQTTPAIWELFMENTWRHETVDIHDWVSDYITRRYGANSASALKAWEGLLQQHYGQFSVEQQPFNTVLNARPSLRKAPKARTWASIELSTDLAESISIWKNLLDAAGECGDSEGYLYDLADFTRQVLSDAGNIIHPKILEAFESRDLEKVSELAGLMLRLLDGKEEVLSTRNEFLLGPWLADARKWGTTKEESDLAEWNARMIITLWTDPASESGVLRDYANRSWSGLVRDFYKPRWEHWFNEMKLSLINNTAFDEQAVRTAIRNNELKWTENFDLQYSVNASGNTIEVSKRLYDNLTPLLNKILN